MLKLLLDLLFPRTCVGCASEGSYLCPECSRQLKLYSSSLPLTAHSPLDGLFACAQYDELLKAAIHRVKYRGEFAILHDLVPLCIDHLPDFSLQCDALIPVPLHPSRERERGFNQSEIVAVILSKKLHVPVRLLLQKIKATPSQATLGKKERLTNLSDSFALSKRAIHEDLHSTRILLVDDVTTTGATLEECARVLKKAGAPKVYGLVLAHGEYRLDKK